MNILNTLISEFIKRIDLTDRELLFLICFIFLLFVVLNLIFFFAKAILALVSKNRSPTLPSQIPIAEKIIINNTNNYMCRIQERTENDVG